jgi:hypothetical protein
MKKTALFAAVLSLTILIIGCGKSLDVVLESAISSFDKASAKAGEIKSLDLFYELSAPDGSAKFYFAKELGGDQKHDFYIETSLAPFIEAGLDEAKFKQNKPDNVAIENGKILVGIKAAPSTVISAKTSIESFRNIASKIPKSIGYHSALDHFGINLGTGFLFEWAKDIDKNDKDIVFVLDPKPFIDAGVDPQKVKGWVFGQVEIDDDNGRKIKVDKFLKPFDL